MIEEHAAHIDGVWFGCLLNACCDIDAISDQVLPLYNDICDVKAETHPERFSFSFPRPSERAAYFDRAANSIYGTRELGKCRVTGCLENAAVKLADLYGNERLTAGQAFRRLL